MSPEEAFCKEHFYVRETLKDVRKEQFRFRKDMNQIKFILLVLLINTFGVTDAFFHLIGGLI
jgi:hypothetical protein